MFWLQTLLLSALNHYKYLKSLLLTWNGHHQKRSSSLHYLKINGLSVQSSLIMRSVTQSRLIYFKLSRLEWKMIPEKHIEFTVKKKMSTHEEENVYTNLKKSMSRQWGKKHQTKTLFLHSWNVRSLRQWPLSPLTKFLSSCSHNILIKIYNVKMNAFKGIQNLSLISNLQINWFSLRFPLDMTFNIFCTV